MKKILGVSLIVCVLVVSLVSSAFAADMTDFSAFFENNTVQEIQTTDTNTSTTTTPAAETTTTTTTPSTTTTTTTTPNTTSTTTTPTSTSTAVNQSVQTTTTSTQSNDNMPNTGVTEDSIIIAFVVLGIVMAVFAFKKMKNYNV